MRDVRRTLTLVSKFDFDNLKKFGEIMAALLFNPEKIFWDTVIKVWAKKLGLAKHLLYQFH